MKRFFFYLIICLFVVFTYLSFFPSSAKAAVCSSCTNSNCCDDTCGYGYNCKGTKADGCSCKPWPTTAPTATSVPDATNTPTPIICWGGHCQPNGCAAKGLSCQYGTGGGEVSTCWLGGSCNTWPNVARVWDKCGDSIDCGPLYGGSYYCGYSSSCPAPTTATGYGSCDENNTTYCYTTLAALGECSTSDPGGICGGNCGYKRTKLIWWKDSVPITPPHCGDVCITDAGCAAQCGVTPPGGATSTPIPTPPPPNPTCGFYNTSTGNTPVTWVWSPAQASGIQVWDNTGNWWFNNWTDPSHTDSIPPGRVVSARTTYDFNTFSSEASITCPVPTPTPTCGPLGEPGPTPVVCSGNTVTLNWGSGTKADFYALRVDAAPNSWNADCLDDLGHQGDYCIQYQYNSPFSFTVTPGINYDAWIHSRCGDRWSAGVRWPNFNCVPSPTIGPPKNLDVDCSYNSNGKVYGNFCWDNVAGVNCYNLRVNANPMPEYLPPPKLTPPEDPNDIWTQIITSPTPGARSCYLQQINAGINYNNWDIGSYDGPGCVGNRHFTAVYTPFTCSITTPTSCPTPPPVLTSITGCLNTILRRYSWNAVPGATGYRFQLYVTAPNALGVLVDHWCRNEALTTNSYTPASCATGTDANITSGTVHWKVLAYYASCPASAWATATYNVDVTGPTPPVKGSCSLSGGNINFIWPKVIDTGCASCSGYACRYWIQGRWDRDLSYFFNDKSAFNSYTVSCAGRGSDYARLRVRQAYDSLGNDSTDLGENWTPTGAAACQCPIPTAYPTIHITGTLQQKSGSTCYQASAGSPFAGVTVAVTPPAPCTTPVCSVTDNWAYSCDISFINSGTCIPALSGSIKLYAHASGSGSGLWGPTPGPGGSCGVTSSTVSYDLTSPATIVKDIIFASSDSDWIKLKSSSYWNSSPPKSNQLPLVIVNPYDADDRPEKVFILGKDATGADTGTALGVDVGVDPDSYSTTHNWHDTNNNYSADYGFTPSKYLEYVKSLKEYKVISNLTTDIDSDNKIYLIKGDQTISTADFGHDKIVLIIANSAGTGLGTVTISGVSNTFNTVNSHSIAIIADQIIFSNTLTEARGIFIANTINTGSTTNQGLKINGNIVALQTFTNNRLRFDTSKPTIFIINSPKMYMDLLPYLSKSIYDWKQLQ